MIKDGKILPNMGVVVGIRSSRQVMPEWAVALATQAWPINTNVCYVPIHCENKKTGSKGPTRDQAAELIIESAKQMNAPYVWFVDDDVEVPYGACRQLLNTLKSAPDDVMAVAGIYPAKRLPIEPVVYKVNGHGPFWKWKKDSIFECALVGMGCMMVKTEAFDRIGEKPWFKDVDTDSIQLTDDGYFAGKLELAGLKMLADAHVLCTHWDNESQTPYRFPEDCYPMLPEGKEGLFQSLPDGWMTIPELTWLSEQAAKHKNIVELGSFKGRSTVVMAKSTEGMVWAIDDWKGPRETAIAVNGEYVHYNVDHSELFEEFQSNTSKFSNIEAIISDHARAEVPVQPDMVFVDGDHRYEAVKRDIEKWMPRLKDGGLLCGHDRNWPGVEQAIKELLPSWTPGPGTLWSATV